MTPSNVVSKERRKWLSPRVIIGRSLIKDLSRNYIACLLSEEGKQKHTAVGHKDVLLVTGATLLPDAFEITAHFGFKFLHATIDGYEINAVFVKDKTTHSKEQSSK